MNKFYNPDTEAVITGTPGDSIETQLTFRFQKQMEDAIEALANIGKKYEARALIATGTDSDGNAFQVTLNVTKDSKYFLPTGGKEVTLGHLTPVLPKGTQS